MVSARSSETSWWEDLRVHSLISWRSAFMFTSYVVFFTNSLERNGHLEKNDCTLKRHDRIFYHTAAIFRFKCFVILGKLLMRTDIPAREITRHASFMPLEIFLFLAKTHTYIAPTFCPAACIYITNTVKSDLSFPDPSFNFCGPWTNLI
jgi:hypothetical protein